MRTLWRCENTLGKSEAHDRASRPSMKTRAPCSRAYGLCRAASVCPGNWGRSAQFLERAQVQNRGGRQRPRRVARIPPEGRATESSTECSSGRSAQKAGAGSSERGSIFHRCSPARFADLSVLPCGPGRCVRPDLDGQDRQDPTGKIRLRELSRPGFGACPGRRLRGMSRRRWNQQASGNTEPGRARSAISDARHEGLRHRPTPARPDEAGALRPR